MVSVPKDAVWGLSELHPNTLTVFQSALLLLAQLTKEQATQQLCTPPPSRFPRGAFERQECLAQPTANQLQIDRSLSKEPRGEAAIISCVINC